MELNLVAVLSWLVYSGGGIIAVSWIAERIAWFGKQTANVKEWIIFGASAFLSCGALAILTYVPADIIEFISQWFIVIAGIFVTVFLGKGFHKINK